MYFFQCYAQYHFRKMQIYIVRGKKKTTNNQVTVKGDEDEVPRKIFAVN